MLRPIAHGKKRIGMLVIASRVRGKILETETGGRFMIVEQQGRDIHRPRGMTLNDAIEAGKASLGIDRILARRAALYGVQVVIITIEEMRRTYACSLADFTKEDLSSSRTNYQGRAFRMIPYQHFTVKFYGPNLRSKRSRAKKAHV